LLNSIMGIYRASIILYWKLYPKSACELPKSQKIPRFGFFFRSSTVSCISANLKACWDLSRNRLRDEITNSSCSIEGGVRVDKDTF